MSRTRRQQKNVSNILNRVIALTLLLLAMVGSFSLGTVYLRHQAATTANEIKTIEHDIVLEKRKLSEMTAEMTRLTTRDSLKHLNEQYALGLKIPSKLQVVRVSENVESRLYRKSSNGLLTASNF